MKYTYISVMAVVASAHLFAKGQEPKKPQKSNTLRYWMDASFTYWYAKEDGLNVAESAQVNDAATTVFASSPQVFKQDFGYRPGFKVGLGLSSLEDWKLYGEYTYYRGAHQVSRTAPAGSTGTGVWNLNSWYLQETFFSHQSLTGTALSSRWKLGMDMGDLLLSAPLSKKGGFTFSPFGGVRSVWMRQQMDLELTVAGASFGGDSFLGSQPVASHNQSHAWGIGPRIGVEGRYNLPMGFNLDGTIGSTLLFTRFSKVKHSEEAAVTYYEAPEPVHMSYNCVRPELDLSLGFGWGRDFGRHRIDLVASYDFTYFWGQNMMRSFVDEYVAGTSSGGLDLYFLGATFKAAYSF